MISPGLGIVEVWHQARVVFLSVRIGARAAYTAWSFQSGRRTGAIRFDQAEPERVFIGDWLPLCCWIFNRNRTLPEFDEQLDGVAAWRFAAEAVRDAAPRAPHEGDRGPECGGLRTFLAGGENRVMERTATSRGGFLRGLCRVAGSRLDRAGGAAFSGMVFVYIDREGFARAASRIFACCLS